MVCRAERRGVVRVAFRRVPSSHSLQGNKKGVEHDILTVRSALIIFVPPIPSFFCRSRANVIDVTWMSNRLFRVPFPFIGRALGCRTSEATQKPQCIRRHNERGPKKRRKGRKKGGRLNGGVGDENYCVIYDPGGVPSRPTNRRRSPRSNFECVAEAMMVACHLQTHLTPPHHS